MNKPNLQLKLKQSYGNKRYYPICAVSTVILEFMKAKTFTEDQLNRLKDAFLVTIEEK